MKFGVSDQRKMPGGLVPTMTIETAKPAEYYQAIRRQKLALSSLSLAEEKREKDRYLKAGARDKIRNHIAEANLQTKLHLAEGKTRPIITANEYDVMSQFRRERDSAKSREYGDSQQTRLQTGGALSGSVDQLHTLNNSRGSVNTAHQSGYGFPQTWQPRGGTPGEPQIVQFGAIRNSFYSRDGEALQRHRSAKAGTKPPRPINQSRQS